MFHNRNSAQVNIIDDLVQDCSNSIANALELLQSCTKPLKSSCSVLIALYLCVSAAPTVVLVAPGRLTLTTQPAHVTVRPPLGQVLPLLHLLGCCGDYSNINLKELQNTVVISCRDLNVVQNTGGAAVGSVILINLAVLGRAHIHPWMKQRRES